MPGSPSQLLTTVTGANYTYSSLADNASFVFASTDVLNIDGGLSAAQFMDVEPLSGMVDVMFRQTDIVGSGVPLQSAAAVLNLPRINANTPGDWLAHAVAAWRARWMA